MIVIQIFPTKNDVKIRSDFSLASAPTVSALDIGIIVVVVDVLVEKLVVVRFVRVTSVVRLELEGVDIARVGDRVGVVEASVGNLTSDLGGERLHDEVVADRAVL